MRRWRAIRTVPMRALPAATSRALLATPVRGRLQLARALERRPGDAEILVALGRTLSRLGEHEEATMHLRRAVDLDPLNARFRYELGLSQMFVGEFAAADDGFVAAISQQPDMVEPYLYRAWVQISWLGNTRGANLRLAQWRDAFGEDEMIGVMLSAGLWGLFTWTTPELDAALASWSTEESGGDPAVWHLAMAEIAFKRGDLTGAADHFERAAALRTRDVANAPDSPWLAAELAIACAGAGRETEARQAADRAVALNPVSEDEWDGSDMLWVRAMVLSMLGDHDAAIAQIEEAARYPTLTTPNALLADPHWAWLAEHPAMKKLAEADGAAWKREH
jgi:tetratricopeptide (TPR) repeat protein